MSVVINTNTAASIAADNLGYANDQLKSAINQLSSGSRLADPSVDPASVGVSLELTAEAADAGVQNTITQNQLALQQTQDGVLNVAGSIVTRISELNTMANDPTMSSTDKANYNAEYSSLTTELTSLSGQTFNGASLGVSGLSATALGFSGTDVSALAASSISGAIDSVAALIATNGAQQATLGFQSQAALSNQTNLEAANSAISDVDVAQESTQLARWNVLVQAGTAMLSQANQSSQIALKLLG
jgi:flagellin